MAYNKNIDYMAAIQQAAAKGDFATAAALEQTRNEKGKGENIAGFTPTNDYSNYLGKSDFTPVGSTTSSGTDWSTVIKNMIANGASSADVGSALQSRVNKAMNTEGLSKYAYDDVYNQAKDYIAANKTSDTYDSLLDIIVNRKDFSYDPTADPAYQAFATQFTNKGKAAMEDTMGEFASLTGGIPSSAAVSAGQQANNNYMSQLSGAIPDLEAQAYNRYQDEYSNDASELSLLQSTLKDRADTMAAAGDFSLYKQLGYSDANIAKLTMAYQAKKTTKSGSGSGSGGSKGGSKGDADGSIYDQMYAAGITTLASAKAWLRENGYTAGDAGIYSDIYVNEKYKDLEGADNTKQSSTVTGWGDAVNQVQSVKSAGFTYQQALAQVEADKKNMSDDEYALYRQALATVYGIKRT